MRRSLSTGCAVALIFACISTRAALSQTSSAVSKTATTNAKSPTSSKTPSNRTASSKKSAKGKTASTSATKTQRASHTASGTHSKSSTTVVARDSRRTSSGKSSKRKATARGQQKIDPERAQEIQEALIREHYLSREVSGTWNQSSEEAMRRYQADHGWQSKTVPDSRALISLGLGPSHDHLLNPESAMVTGPFPTHSASLTPVSHGADPGTHGDMTTPRNSDPAPASPPLRDAPSPQ